MAHVSGGADGHGRAGFLDGDHAQARGVDDDAVVLNVRRERRGRGEEIEHAVVHERAGRGELRAAGDAQRAVVHDVPIHRERAGAGVDRAVVDERAVEDSGAGDLPAVGDVDAGIDDAAREIERGAVGDFERVRGGICERAGEAQGAGLDGRAAVRIQRPGERPNAGAGLDDVRRER